MTETAFFILTGAMGAGKSTVLSSIQNAGIRCVPEPAREILAEQRLIESAGVPEKDSELFTMLMLSRSIHNYHANKFRGTPVVFDRGIPDMIAYARLFLLDTSVFTRAGKEFRYNPIVFYFSSWREIYVNDSERKITFEGAEQFGIETRAVYQSLGYQIIDVPHVQAEERAKFILDRLWY